MPFDGSGNFTRVRNWQQDRDNGIHIVADRHDSEDDNFAAAFNLTFLRNGLVPMSGPLAMGGNYATGLGAGAVGALSVRFADDATTGIFLNGVGHLALVSTGTNVLQVNPLGVAVNGVLNSTGALTQAGNQVYHAGNLNLALYATLASSPTFTGNVTAQAFIGTASNGFKMAVDGLQFLSFNNAALSTRYGYIAHSGAGLQITFNNDQVGGFVFSSTGAGNLVSISNAGVLDAVGGLKQNGSQVWHAGNFDPTLKAPLASPVLTGTPTAPTAAGGTNTTQLATTAFVQAAIPSLAGYLLSATAAATYATIANDALKAPLASPVFTGTAQVPNGEIGTRDLPQTALAAAFAFLAAHRGGHIRYTGAAAAATINTNATTALPIGTAIVIVNTGSGALTITRAGGVALNWNGVDANRVLAVGGMATLLKVDTDTWYISGTLIS